MNSTGKNVTKHVMLIFYVKHSQLPTRPILLVGNGMTTPSFCVVDFLLP
jgi:hypothetical protein